MSGCGDLTLEALALFRRIPPRKGNGLSEEVVCLGSEVEGEEGRGPRFERELVDEDASSDGLCL